MPKEGHHVFAFTAFNLHARSLCKQPSSADQCHSINGYKISSVVQPATSRQSPALLLRARRKLFRSFRAMQTSTEVRHSTLAGTTSAATGRAAGSTAASAADGSTRQAGAELQGSSQPLPPAFLLHLTAFALVGMLFYVFNTTGGANL